MSMNAEAEERVIRQQTVASYTLAEAEADGWLHPLDFIRRPVLLANEQEEEYDRINHEFAAIRNLVRKQYPAPPDTNDFWQGLHDLLDRAVDHQTARGRKSRLPN